MQVKFYIFLKQIIDIIIFIFYNLDKINDYRDGL